MTIRSGFTPLRHLHGSVDFRTRLYRTHGNNDRTIMPGDLLTLKADGTPDIWQGTASGTDPIGVAVNLLDSNKRPFTFNQPTTGVVVPVSTDAWIGIIDDPHVVYTANLETSFQTTDTMAYVGVTAGTGVTAVGRSGQHLATIVGTASVAAPIQILGLSPVEREVGASGNDVEVIIARHQTFTRVPNVAGG